MLGEHNKYASEKIISEDIYYALLAQLSTTFILLKFTFLKILDFV